MLNDPRIDNVEELKCPETHQLVFSYIDNIRRELEDIVIHDRETVHALDHIEYYLRDIEVWMGRNNE